MYQIRIFMFLLFILLSGCGSVNIYFNPNSKIQPKSIFLIMGGEDRTETKAKLENMLLALDFNIVEAKDLNSALSSNKNIYLIYLEYNEYWDVFYYSYKQFYAKITDYKTQAIIGNVNFKGDRSVDSVLEKLIDKIKSSMGE